LFEASPIEVAARSAARGRHSLEAPWLRDPLASVLEAASCLGNALNVASSLVEGCAGPGLGHDAAVVGELVLAAAAAAAVAVGPAQCLAERMAPVPVFALVVAAAQSTALAMAGGSASEG